ncbi:hypothetical protein NQ317_010247 [Molorchus minor]|uniref:Uncharacterized protein n=1 Tax=Molorchus minor TaxID=1323400 RepID=A0ABQ9JHE6_9CUCU|nr:hypothetical protein NQ317_010247 [Molorchus minor]
MPQVVIIGEKAFLNNLLNDLDIHWYNCQAIFVKTLSFHEYGLGIFGTTDITSNVWSAVFAVVILHIAVGLYIYKAYLQDTAKPVEKMD